MPRPPKTEAEHIRDGTHSWKKDKSGPDFGSSDYVVERPYEARTATVKAALANKPATSMVVTLDTYAPGWLDPIGAEHWRYYAELLSRARVMTDADVTLLAAASERWSIYRRASEALKGALTEETGHGRRALAENSVASNALRDYYSLMREFGVGPASRSRAQVQKDDAISVGDIEAMFT